MVDTTSIKNCIQILSQSKNKHAIIHTQTRRLLRLLTEAFSEQYSIPISTQDPASQGAEHVRSDNKRLPISQQQLVTMLPYLKGLSAISTKTAVLMNETRTQEQYRLTTSKQYLKDGSPIQSSAFLLKMASTVTLRAAMALTQSSRATEIAFNDFSLALLDPIIESRRSKLQQNNLLTEQTHIANSPLGPCLINRLCQLCELNPVSIRGLTYEEYDNLALLFYAFSNQEKNQVKQFRQQLLIQPNDNPETKSRKSKKLRLDYQYPSLPGVTQQSIYDKLMQLGTTASLPSSIFNTETFENACRQVFMEIRKNRMTPIAKVIEDNLTKQSQQIIELMQCIHQHAQANMPVEFLIFVTKTMINQNAENTKKLVDNKRKILAVIDNFIPQLKHIDQALRSLRSHIRAKHGNSNPHIRNSIEAYIKSIRENTSEILISTMQLHSGIISSDELNQNIKKACTNIDTANTMLSLSIPRRTSKTLSRIITGVISVVTLGIGALIIGLRNKIKFNRFDLRNRHHSIEKANRISQRSSSLFKHKASCDIPRATQTRVMVH